MCSTRLSNLQILEALGRIYFSCVPRQFRTYCSLTSLVSCEVLRRLDIPSARIPCQLWYAAPGRNFVMGFTGAGHASGKWDGHVVCATEGYILDAALHSLSVQWKLDVPDVVVSARFTLPTRFISRVDLDEHRQVWWNAAPHGADTVLPQDDPGLVSRLADLLTARLSEVLASPLHEPHPGECLPWHQRACA